MNANISTLEILGGRNSHKKKPARNGTGLGSKQYHVHRFYLFVCLIIFFSTLKGKVEREHYFDANIISSVHVDHSLRLVQTFTMAKTNSGDLCPKTYSTTLVHHVTTHSSGTNLYECDQCNQTFDQARSLMNHKLTHSGEKTQRCVQCSKSFPSASQLRTHI